jgi:cytochrome P450
LEERKTCPVPGVAEIDFNSETFGRDHKQVFMQMHEGGCPYAHSSAGDFYAFAAHRDIVEACLDPGNWSSKYGAALIYQPPDTPGVLVSVDPPEHTFEARLVGKAFSKAYFDSFIPYIRDFLDQRIDDFISRGRCDIHKEISEPLPLRVIFRMFGKDIDDAATAGFRDGFVASIGQMLNPRMGEGLKPGPHPLAEHLEAVKARLARGEAGAQDNLLTRFLTATVDGRMLSDAKILAFCSFLLHAGSGTTTILLSNLLYRLLSERERFEKVRADRSLIPLAIEECLRVDAPVHGLFRTNNRAARIGPLDLKPDTKVMLLWGAGNLDPTVFNDPLKFDLDRDPGEVRKHLAFGFGIHVCRGAPLSRLEAQLFLEAVLERLPNLRLDGEPVPETRIPIFQGLRTLHVAWDAKPPKVLSSVRPSRRGADGR